MTKFSLPHPIPLKNPHSPYRNFNYIRPIYIRGTNQDLRDYQIQIVLTRDNFPLEKCKPDGSDIRFRDNTGKKLPYWIESWDSNKAIVWCKIPYIPANRITDIWIIYGNPSASSASDGSAVFEFFDDFEQTKEKKYREIASEASTVYIESWTQQVVHHGTKVFVPYYVVSTGKIRIAVYNTANHSSTQYDVATVGTNNEHFCPSMCVDGNGYLHIFYGCHNSPLKYKKSLNPGDASEWSSEQTIYSDVTYPSAVAYGNKIFVTARTDNHHKIRLFKSTDGGDTWDTNTVIADYSAQGWWAYQMVSFLDSNNSIHITWSNRLGAGQPSRDVCYAYSDDNGATWKKADGTSLSLPITSGNEDYIEEGQPGYSIGRAFGLFVDNDGHPNAVYSVNNESGCWLKHARWNGSSWTKHNIHSPVSGCAHAAWYNTSNDEINVYRRDYTELSKIYCYKSSDKGVTWNEDIVLDNLPGDIDLLNIIATDINSSVLRLATSIGEKIILYQPGNTEHTASCFSSEWTSVGSAWSLQGTVVHQGNCAAYGVHQNSGRHLEKDFDSVKHAIRFWFRAPSATTWSFPVFLVDDAGNNLYFLVAYKNGYFKYYDTAYRNFPTPTTYEANTWYRIDVAWNFDADKYDVWVDGSKISGDGITIYGNGTKITQMRVLVGSASQAGDIYLDNFIIRKYTDPEPTVII